VSNATPSALLGALRSAGGVVLVTADHEHIRGTVSVAGGFVVVREHGGGERRVELARVAAVHAANGDRLWPTWLAGGQP
jgi:hypothetical protein